MLEANACKVVSPEAVQGRANSNQHKFSILFYRFDAAAFLKEIFCEYKIIIDVESVTFCCRSTQPSITFSPDDEFVLTLETHASLPCLRQTTL